MNVASKSKKKKNCVKKLFFCWHIEGQWRGMDPRIRIHPKKSWIRNAAFYKSVTRIHNLLVVLTVWALLPMFRIRNILVRIRILTKKYLWLTDPEAERISSKNVKYVSVLRIRDPVPFWPLDPESRFDFFRIPDPPHWYVWWLKMLFFTHYTLKVRAGSGCD